MMRFQVCSFVVFPVHRCCGHLICSFCSCLQANERRKIFTNVAFCHDQTSLQHRQFTAHVLYGMTQDLCFEVGFLDFSVHLGKCARHKCCCFILVY